MLVFSQATSVSAFTRCSYLVVVVVAVCSLAPNWSPETRSTFLLACETEELLDFGLTFKIKDWNLIGGDDPLGHVFLSAQDLYGEEGDVIQHKIIPPKGQDGVDAGTMFIRCRRANKFDFVSLKNNCLLYTSPSPRDQRGSRMPSSA